MTATQQLMAGNDNASYIRILISFLSTLGCFGSVMAFFEKNRQKFSRSIAGTLWQVDGELRT